MMIGLTFLAVAAVLLHRLVIYLFPKNMEKVYIYGEDSTKDDHYSFLCMDDCSDPTLFYSTVGDGNNYFIRSCNRHSTDGIQTSALPICMESGTGLNLYNISNDPELINLPIIQKLIHDAIAVLLQLDDSITWTVGDWHVTRGRHWIELNPSNGGNSYGYHLLKSSSLLFDCPQKTKFLRLNDINHGHKLAV